jgi:hypothetical protein
MMVSASNGCVVGCAPASATLHEVSAPIIDAAKMESVRLGMLILLYGKQETQFVFQDLPATMIWKAGEHSSLEFLSRR